jgi:hypothetical protein
MMDFIPETDEEEQEIGLLKEWLPKISREHRAYIKGASEALLYAQETPGTTAEPRSPLIHYSGNSGFI